MLLDNSKRNFILTDKMRFAVMAMAGFLLVVGWFNFSAKNVTLIVDGNHRDIVVHGKTVQEVLDQAGIKLSPEDSVRPAQGQRVYDGSIVVVARKQAVEILDGTQKMVAAMTMPSVAEILAAQGLTLGKDDVVEAKLAGEQGKQPSIKITRRNVETFTERKELSYSVEQEADKDLAPWENRVVRKGVIGILENTIRVVTENGKETERKVIKSKTLRKPVNELIRYSVASVSRGNSTYRQVKQLTMHATAYTHTGNRTATGTWPTHGTVAVDPRTIPLGTPLYVEGYGFAVASDTGGAIKGNRLDVFLETEKNAQKWGKKTVKVQILRKIN